MRARLRQLFGFDKRRERFIPERGCEPPPSDVINRPARYVTELAFVSPGRTQRAVLLSGEAEIKLVSINLAPINFEGATLRF